MRFGAETGPGGPPKLPRSARGVPWGPRMGPWGALGGLECASSAKTGFHPGVPWSPQGAPKRPETRFRRNCWRFWVTFGSNFGSSRGVKPTKSIKLIKSIKFIKPIKIKIILHFVILHGYQNPKAHVLQQFNARRSNSIQSQNASLP